MATQNPIQDFSTHNDSGDLAALWEQIYQANPIGHALLDSNLRYVRVNEQLARMHGQSVAAHLGKPIAEVIPQLYPMLEPYLLHVLHVGDEVTGIEIDGRPARDRANEGSWLINLQILPAPDGSGQGISMFVQDITEVRQVQKMLKDQLAFETLLADLSTCFVNLPPGQVDTEIQKAQRSVCECFHLDRSTVWQSPKADLARMQLTHRYHHAMHHSDMTGTAGNEHFLPDDWKILAPESDLGFVYVEADKCFPWIAKQFRNYQAVILASLDDLPAEASLDKEFLRHYGTKASVMIPLVEGGQTLGAITFAMLRETREWPESIVNRLHVVARVFAHALARKRMNQTLCDSEARLILAAESANAGLWDIDMESGDIWTTHKARELLSLASDDQLRYEEILSHTHPEDVEQVRQAIQSAAQSGEHVQFDFRVVLADGGVRWINFCGRPHVKMPGEPVRVMGVVQDITDRKQMEEELQKRLQENMELKKQLEWENLYLKEEFISLNDHAEIVGQSKVIQKVFQQIEQVAPTDSHVLITGETGTGKELVARAIHASSKRNRRIMVKVNCATLPSSLIESELFGREKGAYTGALNRQVGRFEMADGGTIFLDEIGDLTVDLQSKLLRVLQEGEFERLGNPRVVHVDVRVIAATNRDLLSSVREGNFRKDLYYRLSVFPIELPPLRARREDIPLLVWAFVEQFCQRMGKSIKTVPKKTMELLENYDWPGNVRELRNTIEHAMILSRGDRLDVQMPEGEKRSDAPVLTFQEAERRVIRDALQRAGGHIKGPQGAAALLGLKPSSLYAKMQKLGINPSAIRDARPS